MPPAEIRAHLEADRIRARPRDEIVSAGHRGHFVAMTKYFAEGDLRIVTVRCSCGHLFGAAEA